MLRTLGWRTSRLKNCPLVSNAAPWILERILLLEIKAKGRLTLLDATKQIEIEVEISAWCMDLTCHTPPIPGIRVREISKRLYSSDLVRR